MKKERGILAGYARVLPSKSYINSQGRCFPRQPMAVAVCQTGLFFNDRVARASFFFLFLSPTPLSHCLSLSLSLPAYIPCYESSSSRHAISGLTSAIKVIVTILVIIAVVVVVVVRLPRHVRRVNNAIARDYEFSRAFGYVEGEISPISPENFSSRSPLASVICTYRRFFSTHDDKIKIQAGDRDVGHDPRVLSRAA